MVTRDTFTRVLPLLGISAVRHEVEEMLNGYAPLRFAAWWSRVGRLKSMAQWRVKIQTLNEGRDPMELLTMDAVGVVLYRKLRDDGSLHDAFLQAVP